MPMISQIQDQIREKINQAVCEVNGESELGDIKLEHPEVESYGDFSSNIAMVIGKKSKKNPRELAQKIADKLNESGPSSADGFGEARVAGSGFLNIWLQKAWLGEQMKRVITEKENYGKSDIGRGQKVIVEYSSPNIAKPFGIGHLSSTIIGQALYNVYSTLGYQVIGDNHIGDWGTQFGKILYMIKLKNDLDLTIEKLEQWYVEFHQLAKDNPTLEEEGRKWFKKLEDGDTEARDLWQRCVDVSMAEFSRIYELLDVKIDNAYGESSYEGLMPQVIAEAQAKGVAHESEGALVIEVPGIKTPLMLLKSDGGTTYATRDMATVKFRKDKWNPDLVIYEVGGEQTLHFAQVFGAAELMGYVDDKNKLIHTKHGLYLDTDGKKFSTRKGKTVKLEEVLQEAIERAEKLGNKESAKAVGIGAIKYFNLNHNVQSDVVFDWEKIMALDGNSGPYLQYTFARAQSVLRKAGMIGTNRQDQQAAMLAELNAEELMVLRYLYRFGEVVQEAAARYAPNLLCNYLYELAQRFNTFYNKHQIIGSQLRLELTEAVGQVLKNGLTILGIQVLERM